MPLFHVVINERADRPTVSQQTPTGNLLYLGNEPINRATSYMILRRCKITTNWTPQLKSYVKELGGPSEF